MTQFPADPPFGEIVSGQRPERKLSPASVLAAPRTPVTRWNANNLAAGAAALAAPSVGLGFTWVSAAPTAVPRRPTDPQAAADTDNPKARDRQHRYVSGLRRIPAVRRRHAPAGVADLPAPGQPQVAGGRRCARRAGFRSTPPWRRRSRVRSPAPRERQGRFSAAARTRAGSIPWPPPSPSSRRQMLARDPGGGGRAAAERSGGKAAVRRRRPRRRLIWPIPCATRSAPGRSRPGR